MRTATLPYLDSVAASRARFPIMHGTVKALNIFPLDVEEQTEKNSGRIERHRGVAVAQLLDI